MAKLKNGFSNNLTLYQLPILSKIVYICSVIGLTLLVFLGLIVLDEKMLAFFLLIAFIIFNIMVFFLAFKTYLRIDFNSKKFIIREFPGFKEKIINLEDIKSIKVSKDYKYKTFIIDIICENDIIQIKSWSTGYLGFHLMFNNNIQINRLECFCEKCNQYLNKNI